MQDIVVDKVQLSKHLVMPSFKFEENIHYMISDVCIRSELKVLAPTFVFEALLCRALLSLLQKECQGFLIFSD